MSKGNNLTEEYKRVTEIVNKNRKSTSIITIVSILAAIVGFGTLMYLKSQTAEEKVMALQKVDSVKKVKNSLQEQIKVDSSFVVISKREASAKQLVKLFLEETNSSDVLNYYTDTLQTYFELKNISRDSVARRRSIRGRFPRLKYNEGNIFATTHNDSIDVLIDLQYVGDPKSNTYMDVIYNIKLDTNYRIYSISSKKGEQYEADM